MQWENEVSTIKTFTSKKTLFDLSEENHVVKNILDLRELVMLYISTLKVTLYNNIL